MINFIMWFLLTIQLRLTGEWVEPKREDIIYEKPEMRGYCKCVLFWCKIYIDPSLKDREGLILHEMTHARQHGRHMFLDGILYNYSDTYRLVAELETYGAQVRYHKYVRKDQYGWVINALVENYDLDISRLDIVRTADKMFKPILDENRNRTTNP